MLAITSQPKKYWHETQAWINLILRAWFSGRVTLLLGNAEKWRTKWKCATKQETSRNNAFFVPYFFTFPESFCNVFVTPITKSFINDTTFICCQEAISVWISRTGLPLSAKMNSGPSQASKMDLFQPFSILDAWKDHQYASDLS